MTLQEAHEIQRRELISLRAENKRLQKQVSGLFSSEEREALERHIRHLEQVNRTEASRYEAAREQWKLTDRRCFDLEVEILELKDQVASLTEENESLRSRAEKAEAEVRLLNGTNKKLERKLNTNFENSSLPSSALPFRKNIPNSRKPSGTSIWTTKDMMAFLRRLSRILKGLSSMTTTGPTTLTGRRIRNVLRMC